MKYCSHCGKELADEAVVCTACGCPVEDREPVAPAQNSGIETAAKVFMVLGCLSIGWALIPLLWCIPMTVSAFNKIADRKPIGIGFKICTLLFVNTIAGILLLCRNEPVDARN